MTFGFSQRFFRLLFEESLDLVIYFPGARLLCDPSQVDSPRFAIKKFSKLILTDTLMMTDRRIKYMKSNNTKYEYQIGCLCCLLLCAETMEVLLSLLMFIMPHCRRIISISPFSCVTIVAVVKT